MRHFFDRVAVPGGDSDHDGAGAFDFALATEAAVALEAGGFFDSVFFGFARLGEVFHALFDVDVAGGAGADSAAGVLDVDAVLHGEFEEVLALGTLHLEFGGVLAGESLGVFEEELHGDDGWAVFVIGVAEVHGGEKGAGDREQGEGERQ